MRAPIGQSDFGATRYHLRKKYGLDPTYEVLKKREGSWDGRCHFEPWSDDKDGTLAGTLSKLPHHTSGGTLGTADLLENRVSSLEPSGPETETLSLCR
ncbi:hypothetical protein AVEN_196369-1 [Araneus ventricosus]|uniref:Uncharacterized protein n=1 Tax=Araneus ventricosus TaxID=182803 RepID=A0A4Y2AXD5_ARAVE|nr:hypothetical protein AVEN_196369-1 [Araneus ventricosus]